MGKRPFNPSHNWSSNPWPNLQKGPRPEMNVSGVSHAYYKRMPHVREDFSPYRKGASVPTIFFNSLPFSC